MFDQLIVMAGPVVVATVLGAWAALGRLYIARWGGPHLPRWIAWAVTVLLLSIGLVSIAAQLITSSMGMGAGVATTPAAARGAAALLAMMLSPVWVAGASLAVLGIVLHFFLDDLLALAHLKPLITEALAQGLRAVWVTVGLLMLGFGLQGAYNSAFYQYGMTLQSVVTRISPYQFFLNLVAIGVAILGLLTPSIVAADRQRKAQASPAEDPPPAPDA